MSKLTILAKGARKLIISNAPTILTGIAVAGVATTAVMAVRATPEAHERIVEAEVDKGEKLTVVEVVRETWICYLPATLIGGATIACIIGANTVSSKRTAALAGAYSLVDSNYREYQEYVKKEFGDKREQAVKDKIAEDTIQRSDPEDRTVIITGNGTQLCCETFTNTYFESDIESIRKAQNDINYLINNDGYASLNDFYERLNLPHTEIGEQLGWTMDMPLELEFSSTLDKNHRAALAFRYSARPIPNYFRLR